MSNYTFLIDTNKTPLMPVHPKQARKLLESGKAAVFRRFPFTLILKRTVPDPLVYGFKLKIDPGSKFTGFALVSDREECVWQMELEHRGGLIKKKLEQRRGVRRGRRSNLRYRKPRFLNRTRPKGWLAPSLMHRVLTTETWVKRLCRYCPISEIVIERVKFDMQKIQNPEISGVEYQQGDLMGFAVKEYLLEKFKRTCQYCGKDDRPMEVEHIHPKSKGGSNRVSNLTLACTKCNQKKGSQNIEQFLKRTPDLLKQVIANAKKPLKDATAVNATRNKIVMTMAAHAPVSTGTGAQTKFNRKRFGIAKTHANDAACVGDVDSIEILTTQPLIVKATGQGGRQKFQTDKYGYPQPNKYKPLKPIHGFKTGDIVQLDIPKGVNKGSYIARLCPYTNGGCEIYPKTGKKRIGSKLKYVSRVVHRKDGYSYA